MSRNIPSKDLRTLGIVLRRTNYGEADRILNIITPEGKVSAIAKSVRKSKSKLAGGIELFTLSDLVIHQGKNDLGILTSARMIKHYGNILQDYRLMETAALMLKKISNAAEQTDSAKFFDIAKQGLEGLNEGVSVYLVEAWFWLNFKKTIGEEMNLYRDIDGKRLMAEARYDWRSQEAVFIENPQGEYGVNEIKMLRLMTAASLKVVSRVRVEPELVPKIYDIIKLWVK